MCSKRPSDIGNISVVVGRTTDFHRSVDIHFGFGCAKIIKLNVNKTQPSTCLL